MWAVALGGPRSSAWVSLAQGGLTPQGTETPEAAGPGEASALPVRRFTGQRGKVTVAPSRGEATLGTWESVSHEPHGCLEKILSEKAAWPPRWGKAVFSAPKCPTGNDACVLPCFLVSGMVERLPERNGKSALEA